MLPARARSTLVPARGTPARTGHWNSQGLAPAWLEEWARDLLVWHDHGQLFPGAALELSPDLLAVAVPLLAVLQLTHSRLDGFRRRVRDDPGLPARLGWAREPGD